MSSTFRIYRWGYIVREKTFLAHTIEEKKRLLNRVRRIGGYKWERLSVR